MPVFVSTQFKVSKQNSILIHSSGVFTIFPRSEEHTSELQSQ